MTEGDNICRSYRIIGGKPRWIIVNEDGKIINNDPSKEELKGLKEEPYKVNRKRSCTDDELLEFMRLFYKENRRAPKKIDFISDPRYPGFDRYIRYFGSWNKALEKAGLNVRKGGGQSYTDEELLGYLTDFNKENGMPPTEYDFKSNPEYPSHGTYVKRFGSWSKALKLVGLDVDSMVRKGVLETTRQKGRLSELYVLEHFKEESVDMSGKNCNSPFDGICPKGQTYDVKSITLRYNLYWPFCLGGLCRYGVEWFYLVAFDKYYKKLLHVWRIPGNFVDGDNIKIWIGGSCRYNVENMKEFEITDKFKDIDIFRYM